MTTRRWYYYIPASGEPRGLVHAIERHNLDGLPGTMRPVCGSGVARRRARRAAGGRLGGSPWSTRLAATSPTCRAWTPGRSSRSGSGASRSCRRATWCSSSRRCGRRRRSPPTRPPRRRCTASRIARFDVAAAGRRAAARRDRVRTAAADGRLVRRRGTRQLGPAGRRRDGQCRQPALPADRLVTSADRRDQLVLLDLWGKQAVPGAVYADITWVAFTGATVPAEMARAFDAIARGPRHGGEHGPGRPGRGSLRPRVRGRSRGSRGAGAPWVCGRDLASHRP